MNTELYLIMQLLQRHIPEDISNKILLVLLGIAKTRTANCIKSSFQHRKCIDSGGRQYEIRPQQTMTQNLVMFEIRIAQFDSSNKNYRSIGAIMHIKKYMKELRAHFIRRFRFLYC
jgi:hypothetical protein